MLEAHLHVSPTPLHALAPTVPPRLEQVVMRLLAKDPEERYPCAEAASEAVKEALTAVQVGPRQGNLPVWLTPFVGREQEVAAIGERLQYPTCRLLTLVGPGGIGKTRLAVEAAQVYKDAFADGAFFCPLAPLQSADAIVPTVSQALGFSFYDASAGGASARGADAGGAAEPRQQLFDHLRNKTVLLVMDNFEHLLTPQEGGVELVTDLLKTAPGIKVLVTSRARLNVQEEHLFSVSILSQFFWLPSAGGLDKM
jgi:hypothetical protein